MTYCTGCFLYNFGIALIGEGISDLFYATTNGYNGTFSWKKYTKQKIISLAISATTAGVGTIGNTLEKC